ncbi:MAG: type III-B CRISPR module RAMP protein Cmr1 [Candidatus Altiarchaeales archaeon WOR_SM1_79]|nr:MAG: type III-B CRISPR module RAMP protein Cmr1 [Candidatus Altiarchaeales archaeon WOR_SM1_79]
MNWIIKQNENQDKNIDSSKIKETGIIGSLRWWYEALVRGYGGYACDPSNSECKFDYDTYEKTKNIEDGLEKVCPVCRLFGCTGWSRRFRLEIKDAQKIPLCLSATSKSDYRHTKLDNLWWLKQIYKKSEKVFFDDNICIEIHTINKINENFDEEDIRNMVLFLFAVISKQGSIGAKIQNGFGVFDIVTVIDKNRLSRGLEKTKELAEIKQGGQVNFPSFNDFFSLTYSVSNDSIYIQPEKFFGTLNSLLKNRFVPSGFSIKYDLRKKIKNDSTPCKAICSNFEYLCKGENEKMVRKTISRFLFGSDKDKFSAKINFTHLYKDKENENYLLNVFGFVPNKVSFENKTLEFNIRSIKNILYIEFGNPYNEEYGVSCLSEVIK